MNKCKCIGGSYKRYQRLELNKIYDYNIYSVPDGERYSICMNPGWHTFNSIDFKLTFIDVTDNRNNLIDSIID